MRSFVITWVFLVLLLAQFAHAADAPIVTAGEAQSQNLVNLQLQESNRFLSAEVAKQMKALQEDLLKKVNDNNDANFKALDDRMMALIEQERLRVVIGGLGAVLIANAFIGLAYLWITKRYSYETHLEKLIGRQQKEFDAFKERYDKTLQELQKDTWNVQKPQETIGMKLGQDVVSNQSQMNQWQYQAPYEGGWQRTDNVVPQPVYEQMQEMYQPMSEPWKEPQQRQNDQGW